MRVIPKSKHNSAKHKIFIHEVNMNRLENEASFFFPVEGYDNRHVWVYYFLKYMYKKL